MPPMPDSKHVDLLRQGPEVWNRNRPKRPNLADADLDHLNLRGVDLSHAQMWGVNFCGTDLSEAILDKAHLPHANLTRARLIRTSLEGADLGQAWVYGAAIWDTRGVPSDESWLSITPDGADYSPGNHLRASGLQMAQFLYSLMSRRADRRSGAAIGGLIDSLTRMLVLLLGRFSAERMAILEAVHGALSRQHSLYPVLFDFKKPDARDLTETLVIMAHASRLIIADLTDPSSVPHELTSIIPNLPSVPVVPIIAQGHSEYAMFEHWRRYPWVMPIHRYNGEAALIAALPSLLAQAEDFRHRQSQSSPLA